VTKETLFVTQVEQVWGGGYAAHLTAVLDWGPNDDMPALVRFLAAAHEGKLRTLTVRDNRGEALSGPIAYNISLTAEYQRVAKDGRLSPWLAVDSLPDFMTDRLLVRHHAQVAIELRVNSPPFHLVGQTVEVDLD
jgi:hypothetical protein